MTISEGDANHSNLRARWQADQLDPVARRILEEDAEVFLHQPLSTPCLNAIVRAQGSWIEDAQGRCYLDFHGNSVHQIGYGHPRVIQAVKDQLDTLPFCPRRYTNQPAIEFGQRLVEIAPVPQGKVLFAPGGSAAIGIALKIARLATGRFKTVSMWDSFHGASLDAISVGGEEHFRRGIGPLLPGAQHVPPPDPLRCPLCKRDCSLACANYLSYVLDHEGDVAAVIAEPVRATTAVKPPDGYWPQVREACDRHGALLIFDEIPTGLGRTGMMFATELTGVRPDILVLGKGLGGAVFPMAAVIVSGELQIPLETSLGHYTHEKSPIGAAAGLATLDVIRDEDLVRRSQEQGALLTAQLRALKTNHPCIVDVRGMGLLVGVEMNSAAVAEATMYEALKRGLSFKVSAGTVLTLTPPLNISGEELALAIQILTESIAAAEHDKGTAF